MIICQCQLPKEPCDQEVEAALDLGAVDEAVDVAGVHRLSVLSSCAFTRFTVTQKQREIVNTSSAGQGVALVTHRAVCLMHRSVSIDAILGDAVK